MQEPVIPSEIELVDLPSGDTNEIVVLDTGAPQVHFDPNGYSPAEAEAITEMLEEEKTRAVHSTDMALPFVILRILNYGAIPIFILENKVKDNAGALYDTRVKLTETIYGIPREVLGDILGGGEDILTGDNAAGNTEESSNSDIPDDLLGDIIGDSQDNYSHAKGVSPADNYDDEPIRVIDSKDIEDIEDISGGADDTAPSTAQPVRVINQAILISRMTVLPAGSVIYISGFYIPDYIARRWTLGMLNKPMREEHSRTYFNTTDLKGAPPPVIPLLFSPVVYGSPPAANLIAIKYTHSLQLEADILNYLNYFQGEIAIHSKAIQYAKLLDAVAISPTPLYTPTRARFDPVLIEFARRYHIPIHKYIDPNAVIMDIINSGLYNPFARSYIEAQAAKRGKANKEIEIDDNADNASIDMTRSQSIMPQSMYNLHEQIEMSLYEYAYKSLYGTQEFAKLKIGTERIRTLNNIKAAIGKELLPTIQKEVEHIREQQRAFIENRCEHIPVLMEFYSARTIDSISQGLHKLQAFINDKSVTTAIRDLPINIRVSLSLNSKDEDQILKEEAVVQQKILDTIVVDVAGGTSSNLTEEVINGMMGGAVINSPGVCRPVYSEITYGGLVKEATGTKRRSPGATDMASPESKYDGYVMCKVCGLRLICPHKILAARYQIGQIRRFQDIRDTFKQFVDSNIAIGDNVICRICGEVLYLREDTLSSIVQTVAIHGTNEQELWRDAQRMISEFVIMEVILDRTHIIRDMINTCYASIASKLARLPYGERPEKWREIYARTAFAAFLMNFESRSGKVIRFDYKKYRSTVPIAQQKRNDADIAEYRARFVDKIKDAVVYNRMEVKQTWATISPIFKFALHVYRRAMTIEEALKLMPTPAEVAAAIKADKLTPAFMYKKLTLVPRASKVLAEDEPLWRLQKNNSKEDSVREQHLKIIFNKMVKFLQSGIWADVEAGENNYANHPSVTSEAILRDIAAVDAMIRMKVRIMTTPPSIPLPGAPYIKPRPIVSLQAIYDPETKRKQQWDTLVYDAGELEKAVAVTVEKYPELAGRVKEYHTANVTEAPGDKTRMLVKRKVANALLLGGLRAIDMYSSTTKTFITSTIGIRSEEIESAVRDLYRDFSNMESMLNFYTHKCPEGNSHEYEGDTAAVCKKCGRTQTMIDNTARGYYEKYKKIYESAKAEIQRAAMAEYHEQQRISISHEVTRADEAEKQEPLPQLTDELIKEILARFPNIHKNQIRYFGEIGGVKLAEALADGYIPPELPNANAFPLGIVEGFISSYYVFKTKNQRSFPMFREFKQIFRSMRLKIPPAELISWMRFILFDDILSYHSMHTVEATEILTTLLRQDSLYCVNEVIINQVAPDLYVDEPVINEDIIEEKASGPAVDGDAD